MSNLQTRARFTLADVLADPDGIDAVASRLRELRACGNTLAAKAIEAELIEIDTLSGHASRAGQAAAAPR